MSVHSPSESYNGEIVMLGDSSVYAAKGLLDTGATGCCIGDELAQKLELPLIRM